MSVETNRLVSLPGLIPHDQGMVLARLAAEVPASGVVVELGSYKGKSTCYLAYGAKQSGAHVYAIDPWDLLGNPNGKHRFAEPETRKAFDRVVRGMGYSSLITPIQGFSQEVAGWWAKIPGPKVDLLYIDGDHSYEAVMGDFVAWHPHLAENAVVAFDDLDTPKNPGVRKAVDLIKAQGNHKSFEVLCDRLAVFRL